MYTTPEKVMAQHSDVVNVDGNQGSNPIKIIENFGFRNIGKNLQIS